MFVVMVDVVVDSGDQLHDIPKHTASKAINGQVPKEAFHHIEPGSTGGCEVNMEPRMTIQPALDSGMFVSRVVVHDQM